MDVCIRPLTLEDAKVSYKWRNDPEIWKYTGRRPTTEITQEIELEWAKTVLQREDEYRFAIISREGSKDTYIGNAHLAGVNRVKGIGHYNIFIGEKRYWGKGCAKKATELILGYALNELELRQIDVEVAIENTPVVKLCEKCGFIRVSGSERYDSQMGIQRVKMTIKL